jgi:AraC family transcriptional regulator of arabinose operon
MDKINKNLSVIIRETELTFIHVGEVLYPPGASFGPRHQNGYQLVLMHRGKADILIDDRPHELPAQSVALLHPGHKEHFFFARHRETYHTWCTVDTRPYAAFAGVFTDVPFHVPLSSRMEALLRTSMAIVAPGQPEAEALRETLAKSMFLEYLLVARGQSGGGSPLPEPILRAQRWIHGHFDESISLKDLSEASHVSGPHLIRLFRQHMQTTPIAYLWRMRVERASQLLRDSGLPISEIAWRTGFQTSAHLSRLIKNRYGISPRRLRERFWNMV